MESSYVCRIGGTPSYCDMVSSHPTCCPIVIDVRWPSKSATPWTTIRVTSSWRFTTSSVMGSPTLRPRPSPPRTCTTNPEFLQVAPHGGGRPSPKVKHQGRARRHCHQRRGGKKGDLLIRNFWPQEADSIQNMRVVNTDGVSYQSNTPEKYL